MRNTLLPLLSRFLSPAGRPLRPAVPRPAAARAARARGRPGPAALRRAGERVPPGGSAAHAVFTGWKAGIRGAVYQAVLVQTVVSYIFLSYKTASETPFFSLACKPIHWFRGEVPRPDGVPGGAARGAHADLPPARGRLRSPPAPFNPSTLTMWQLRSGLPL